MIVMHHRMCLNRDLYILTSGCMNRPIGRMEANGVEGLLGSGRIFLLLEMECDARYHRDVHAMRYVHAWLLYSLHRLGREAPTGIQPCKAQKEQFRALLE